MAEKVLRMPGAAHSGLQLRSASGTGRGLGGDVPLASEAAIHAVAGGQSLSDQQRSYFEPLFGVDFSGVRLHTGPSADQAAESIGALAYTRGRDVVFRRDHYRPETESGQQLLAHELAHTVQQGSAPAKPPSADRSGGNIFSPLRLHSTEPSVLRLQRQEELHDRTLQELFVVTESFEAFQHAIEEWLARYVMSSAAREQALVRASNLAALHQQLLIGLDPGQTVRIQAALVAGQDRYERVMFSTPGLPIPSRPELSVLVDAESPPVRAPALITLELLRLQGGLGVVGAPRQPEDGEPSIWQHGYVRSRFFSYRANIDMVHFFVAGYWGEGLGGLIEWIQGLRGSPSAYNPQDYFSNMLGTDFYNSFYSPGGELSDQLNRFFSGIESGRYSFRLPLHDQPSAGVPSAPYLPEEVQQRLVEHDSEAIECAIFVEFIRSYELWVTNHPDAVSRILGQNQPN